MITCKISTSWGKRLFLPLLLLLATNSTSVSANPDTPRDSNQQAVTTPFPRLISSSDSQSVAKGPYLNSVLPDSAFFYLRLPSAWGLLGTPNGNVFNKALQSTPHVTAMQDVRNGVLSTFISDVPAPWQALFKLIAGQIKSPLELAAMIPSTAGSLPTIELLLTTTLEQKDITAVNELLQSLITPIPNLTITKPLQADGSGTISTPNASINIYFDNKSQRIFFDSSIPENVASNSLARRISALQPNPQHRMLPVEREIDAGGQGALFWVDPKPILGLAASMGHAGEAFTLRAVGLGETKSLALGSGASNGKQHIKLILEMPQIGLRNLFPALNMDIALNTAGKPDMALMLGLPTVADLTRFEGALKTLLPAATYREYQQAKDQLPAIIGLSLEQLFDTFGSDFSVIGDQAGYYTALRVRNHDQYRKMLEYLVNQFKLKHETRELLDATFHHLMIPALTNFSELDLGASGIPGLVLKLLSMQTHIYWVESQGYLLMADVPQVLMDQIYMTPKIKLATWLDKSQGLDPTGALLLGTISAKGIPQLLYQMHLWFINYLGDITNQPVDIFTLPSAYELGLPQFGAYSFQMTTSPKELGLELTYESSPLEIMLAFGWTQMAFTVGTAAALATGDLIDFSDLLGIINQEPSLNKSTLDTLVSERDKITEFYNVMNRFPSVNEINTFTIDSSQLTNATMTVTPDTGIITIQITGGKSANNSLILIPITGPATDLHWECAGTLEAESRPQELCSQ
ncbi:hypothetical protein TI04_07325 [Achromatium sp. WMS2]|nr:hypothetical protein TI04_07325 [Achromatium sp. WMS2]